MVLPGDTRTSSVGYVPRPWSGEVRCLPQVLPAPGSPSPDDTSLGVSLTKVSGISMLALLQNQGLSNLQGATKAPFSQDNLRAPAGTGASTPGPPLPR